MLKNLKKGFTLVELLVVITIIAILSVTAYVALSGQTVKARDAKRKDDLAAVQTALELYFVKNTSYPATLDDTNAATSDGTDLVPTYMPSIPKDPGNAGHAYSYTMVAPNYELAATLEMAGGDPTKFQSYIVGKNSSAATVASTAGGFAKYNSAGTLTPCNNGLRLIKNAQVGITGPAANDMCIPYDPNN